jgi:hypothetical protein
VWKALRHNTVCILTKAANWGRSASKPTGNRLDVSDFILFTARTLLQPSAQSLDELWRQRVPGNVVLVFETGPASQRWKFVNAMDPHQDAPLFGSQVVSSGYRFHAKFYFRTEVIMKITVLGDMSPCSVIRFLPTFLCIVSKIDETAVLPSGTCPRLCSHVSYCDE